MFLNRTNILFLYEGKDIKNKHTRDIKNKTSIKNELQSNNITNRKKIKQILDAVEEIKILTYNAFFTWNNLNEKEF